MSSIITRRNMLRGLLAAPAIVHVGNLMPIKSAPATLMVKNDGPYLTWTKSLIWSGEPTLEQLEYYSRINSIPDMMERLHKNNRYIGYAPLK